MQKMLHTSLYHTNFYQGRNAQWISRFIWLRLKKCSQFVLNKGILLTWGGGAARMFWPGWFRLVMGQSLPHANILTLSMWKLVLMETYLHNGWFGDITPVDEATSMPRTDNNASHWPSCTDAALRGLDFLKECKTSWESSRSPSRLGRNPLCVDLRGFLTNESI